MVDINNAFVNCENNLREMFEFEKNRLFAKILGVKHFHMYRKNNFCNILIDGNIVCDVHIDKYNNITCEIPYLMPIDYLSKFRNFFNEYLENKNSYHHRSGTGFFVEYFEKYYKYLCVPQVQQMCDIDDIDCEKVDEKCFRGWLITTSYCTKEGGVLVNNSNYSKLNWNIELFKKSTCDLK